MDNELVFLTIITIIVLGFCIANIVSYLINKNHIKETEGTVISVKMPNPTTEKMRNSKWAIVTYKVAGKNYTSQNRIQVPMSVDVGSHIPVPVSYTHLDVYKRQDTRDLKSLGGNSVPVQVRLPAVSVRFLFRDLFLYHKIY